MGKGAKVVMKQQAKMPPGADEFSKLIKEAQRIEQSRPVAQIMARDDAPAEDQKPLSSEDIKRWKIIYPAFLDKAKSCSEGRRVSQELAVEAPTIERIGSACLRLGYSRVVLEPRKMYPRDFGNHGRVRILICNDKHEPIVPEITNMRHLLVAVARTLPEIPTTPTRQLTAKEQKNAAKKAAKKKR